MALPDAETLSPAAAPAPAHNPVRDRAAWEAMRAAVLADPGKFHGGIAGAAIHWLADGAWLTRGDGGVWSGWDAATAAPVSRDLGADFAPWSLAFDDSDAPHYRWFSGGTTNAAFNEVDRHVLAGHGDESALIFEGDRWDMAANKGRGGPVDEFAVSRRTLMLESAKCALALKRLA